MTGPTAKTDRPAAPDRRSVMVRGFGILAAPAVLRVIPANAQSRTIKIGHVSPRTGPLAGFGEADGFILDQVRAIVAKGLESGGKTFPVETVSKDSQTSRAPAPGGASALIFRHPANPIVSSTSPA